MVQQQLPPPPSSASQPPPVLARLPASDSGIKVAGINQRQLASRVTTASKIVDEAVGPQMVSDPASGELLPYEEFHRRQELRNQFAMGG